MKKIYFIIIIFLINVSIKAQIGTSINQVFLNSQTTVVNCNTLDFGTTQNNSLVFYYKLTRPGSLPSGTGTLRIMMKFNSSSTPQIFNSLNISDSSWSGISKESTIMCNIGANQVQVNGSSIYLEFETSGSIKTTSCEYSIIKTPLPTFTLSQTTVSVGCNDFNSKTFTVTPANIPIGATLTYLWSNTGGWTGSSTSSSITLAPTTGTSLPGTITVTPFINGVSQPQLNCSVTRAAFTSLATISGTQNICTGTANYTIAGVTAGQTVSWSLSNTATASLTNQTNSGVTVNFNGNGAQTLTATITNACNQQVVKTWVINDGSTSFTSTATISGSTTSTCTGTRVFNINNLPAGQTVSWSVSDTNIATLSGITNTQTTVSFIGSGTLTLYANITNSCGQSSVKSVQMYTGAPVLTSFTCGTLSKDFCSGGQVYSYVSSIPELNINDKITAVFSGMSSTEINLASNWEWQPLNSFVSLTGTRNLRTIGSLSFGNTGIQVRARNSCGWSAWFPLNWELVALADPPQKLSGINNTNLTVLPNPSNSSWNFYVQNTKIESIDVVDVFGKKVFSNMFSENQVTVDCSSYQKGIYFAKVKTALGIETFKLIRN